ncbi:MAG: zinc-ribbon domain-containing protein, partial [Chloroflexi bacterium]|nr:zinc-ribbon domain-containing protein [Chloroflexota bacterium]
MYCSKCGTQADDSAQRCSKCGNELRPSAAAYPAPSQPQVIVVRSGKSAGLAAVLSFLWCGLGQIYNGQIGKGVVMGVLYLISAILIFLVIGIITTPILWTWGMVDAYRTAERINR